jgi:predicted GNAT family acetyltransferase
VVKAVDFAREAKLRVVPICSYARAVIQRDPVLTAATR